MDAKKLGDRIKSYRKQMNCSSDKFSELVEISSHHIRNVESGTYPSLDLFLRISEAVHVFPNALYCDESPMSISQLENNDLLKFADLSLENLRLITDTVELLISRMLSSDYVY